MGSPLLNNTYAPVTFSFGFVRSPIDRFADAFISWQREIFAESPAGIEFTQFSASLPDALRKLEPLTTPLDRYLLIETESNWSAIFSNGLRVNDVLSPVSYLSEVLKCHGLLVSAVPDRSEKAGKDGLRIYGAVTFTLYGPDQTDWLNRIRHVGVTNDVGGWKFAAEGEIQPYEETKSYQKRKRVDRFTAEMLEAYCNAVGIRVFDANFYAGQCVASRIKRAISAPTMSIAEAHSHLYL